MKYKTFKKDLTKELVHYGVPYPPKTEMYRIWKQCNNKYPDAALMLVAYSIACDLNSGFTLDEILEDVI